MLVLWLLARNQSISLLAKLVPTAAHYCAPTEAPRVLLRLLLLLLLGVAFLVVVDMDYTGRKFKVIHMVQPATWDSKNRKSELPGIEST
jgi:hypothetical protein